MKRIIAGLVLKPTKVSPLENLEAEGQSGVKAGDQTSKDKKNGTEQMNCRELLLPILAVLASLTSALCWAIHTYTAEKNGGMTALVLITPICISAGWLANFMARTDQVNKENQRIFSFF